ncbi:putative lipoprotein [Treponema primitia ZAS-2]|uniref:Putative lipoprotein n=1 Tax=Treponema primitia (strain ATCC BAA-887 / DSM 12427 / ZAS-2) TaxID=545694 RepID=F5YN09_TREPZ|nr:putative lipoprotein [Treponema primitia ZAS-2]
MRFFFLLLITIPFIFSCASRSEPGAIPVAPAPEAPVPSGEPVPEAPPAPPAPLAPLAAPEGSLQAILSAVAEFLSQGDYDGALACFDRLEPEDAASTGIRLLRASVLSSAGRMGDARAIADEILLKEPTNTEALFVLATLESAQGKAREQRALLEKILTIDPKHVQALCALGTIAFQGNSLTNAASYFDRALAAEPNNGDALVGRAGVYRSQRKPKESESLLNKAITLYPRWSVPFSERARLYRGAGFYDDALKDLDRAKRLNGQDYWIAVDRGMTLVDLDRKQEALPEFNRAIAMDPEVFIAYVYSAGIKDELGDYEGAERDYGVLVKLKPEYYFAYEGLGVQKMRRGLWAEARDAFMEAYKQTPETSYALLASLCWMRAGRVTDPKQFLEQALRKVERESLEWYMLRLYHDLSGDSDVAARIDREKDPVAKARMLYYLAGFYDVRGNTSLANRYYAQVYELEQRSIIEWRLNEWIVDERNLKVN